MLGQKKLASLQSWPSFDKKFIDQKTEQSFELVESVRADIIKIKGLAKIAAPKRILIFVSPKWKIDAIELLKKKKLSRPDMGQIMKEMPAFAKQLTQKFPDYANSELFGETAVLSEFLPRLEKEFSAKIEAISADEADVQKYPKAKNSLPKKPAIVIE